MATNDQLKALVVSHADGDDPQFYAVAMQVAAKAARSGQAKFAQELRDLVDDLRQKGATSARIASVVAVTQPRANKGDLANRLRRYGMGVPDLDRAVRSAADALTLIAQGSIHPFERAESTSKVREMNLHELPWPSEELESLGETEVSMRVTLSYFVEPNPSSRGWTGRYVYPSHGLRFATKRADENVSRFRASTSAHATRGNDSLARRPRRAGCSAAPNNRSPAPYTPTSGPDQQ